jgi:hypothetical protein
MSVTSMLCFRPPDIKHQSWQVRSGPSQGHDLQAAEVWWARLSLSVLIRIASICRLLLPALMSQLIRAALAYVGG